MAPRKQDQGDKTPDEQTQASQQAADAAEAQAEQATQAAAEQQTQASRGWESRTAKNGTVSARLKG